MSQRDRYLIIALCWMMLCQSVPLYGQPALWADAITLENGSILCRISPAVGRVVAFGKVGGANLIWTNDTWQKEKPFQTCDGKPYINYGGEKVWVYPQELWKDATGSNLWPPDGVIDGQPWKLLAHDDHMLTMQSDVSDAYGIRVLRTFRLTDDQPQMTIDTLITRTQANPFPVMAWSVTQIVTPKAVLLDMAPGRPLLRQDVQIMQQPPGVSLMNLLKRLGGTDGCIMLTDQQSHGLQFKFGTLGSHVAAIYDDTAFVQCSELQTDGAYPKSSNMQYYQHTDGQYAEMEVLSPLVMLAVGEQLHSQMRWMLCSLPMDMSDWGGMARQLANIKTTQP